jgi:hypothetical protein
VSVAETCREQVSDSTDGHSLSAFPASAFRHLVAERQPHALASRRVPFDKLPAQRWPVYGFFEKALRDPVAPAFFRPARQAEQRDAPVIASIADSCLSVRCGKCESGVLRIAVISAMVRSSAGRCDLPSILPFQANLPGPAFENRQRRLAKVLPRIRSCFMER